MSSLTQFKLHPSVIYSLIREQAGSPEKALAELIMNSIDAGAKNIFLEISANKFSIKDDGLGFKDEAEIELFFGKFGTPHKKGDSAYGQFRLGRGQIFALAKTEWRSGSFGMTVDLIGKSKTDVHGYSLHEFGQNVVGCEITGEFYESLHIFDGVQSAYVFNNNFDHELAKYTQKPNFSVFDAQTFFKRLIANVCLIRNINIHLNGQKVGGLLAEQGQLIKDTNTAAYYHTKSNNHGGIVLLNKGVFITRLGFSLPMVIDFKESPNLNIARNQINAECPIYIKGRQELYGAIFDAYVKGDRWAKGVGNVIASGISSHLSQFDSELFLSVATIEDRITFAKKYKVHMVGVSGVQEVSLWDALNHAKQNKVYVNNFQQNHGIAPKYFKSIIENMECCENTDGMPISDYLLIDPQGSLELLLSKESGFKVSCADWFSEEKGLIKQDNIIGHTFYLDTSELESDSLSRISIKQTKTAPKNASLKILAELEQTKLNFEVSKQWVNKNDLARQTLEDGLYDLQQGLSEMLNEACGLVPENIKLSLNKKIIPFFVQKLNFSTVHSRCYELNGNPYLIITAEDFAQGGWMSPFIEYLMSEIDSEEEHVYENAKFNTDFHNEMSGKMFHEIFNGLGKVSAQVSAVMVKKPMRSSRKAPLNAMKNSWDVVFKEVDGLLDDKELEETWSAFTNINTN